ncbi:MAG: hypothetical protein ACPGXX_11305 [Planctomycetaceae bacterium]
MTRSLHRREILQGFSGMMALPWLESVCAEDSPLTPDGYPRRFAFPAPDRSSGQPSAPAIE